MTENINVKKLFGIQVNVDLLENPVLKKLIDELCVPKTSYWNEMYAEKYSNYSEKYSEYSEYSNHNDKASSRYSDYSEYSEHEDYTESSGGISGGAYWEGSSHEDNYRKRKKGW